MEISFESKGLRDLCEDESLAIERLGATAAEALKNRLADIRVADNIHEVLAGRPEAGKYQSTDCYRFELVDGFQLTVLPNHALPRINAAGTTDWTMVRRVMVISLGR